MYPYMLLYVCILMTLCMHACAYVYYSSLCALANVCVCVCVCECVCVCVCLCVLLFVPPLTSAGFIDFIVEPTFTVLTDMTEKIVTPLIDEASQSSLAGFRRAR